MKNDGFTLLEVIVALVILAYIGMGVYGWINTNVTSLQRAQDHLYRRQVTENAISLMKSINPMVTPSGRLNMGIYSVRWSSQLIDGPKTSIESNRFLVAMYQTQVEVFAEEQPFNAFNVLLSGWAKQ